MDGQSSEVENKRVSKFAKVSFWAAITALMIAGQTIFPIAVSGTAILLALNALIQNKKKGGKVRDKKFAFVILVIACISLLEQLFWTFYFSLDHILDAFTSILMIAFIAALGTALFSGIAGLVQTLRSGGKITGIKYAAVGLTISLLFCVLIGYGISLAKTGASNLICGANLTELGKAMLIYAQDNDGRYPSPDKWCDLLIEHVDVEEKLFICPGAERAGFEAKCHYAMNSNAEPNSPGDVVLFFETKGGWNQFGGLELITAENHLGNGCNVAFVDCYVDFVPKEDFEKLNWGDEKDKGLLIKD